MRRRLLLSGIAYGALLGAADARRMHGGVSPSMPGKNFTNLSLSSSSFVPGTAPVVIGSITVTLSDSSAFTGTINISGTNASYVAISGSAPTYSLVTTGSMPTTPGGPYTFTLTPIQTGVANSGSFSQSESVTGISNSVALITLNSTVYTYDPAAGTNLGNYIDPAGRFSMTCIRVTRVDCPIRVDFRSIPGWSCVIFDLGDCVSSTPANLPGYSVAWNGQNVSTPNHGWESRWRIQSGAWPFAAVPISTLVDNGLMLDYDTATWANGSTFTDIRTYTPMSMAGFPPYMPQTGDIESIGYMMQIQGGYIAAALANDPTTPQALASVLAQGEAGGTIPNRYFDPSTGATIDLLGKYPSWMANGTPPLVQQPLDKFQITLGGTSGTVVPDNTHVVLTTSSGAKDCNTVGAATVPATVWVTEQQYGHLNSDGGTITGLPSGATGTVINGSYIPSNGVQQDSAHYPDPSYLPFLLTGDPYFLENLQSQVIYNFQESSGFNNNYMPGAPQTRGMAWNLRTIHQAAIATPSIVPSWLLNQAQMQKYLDFCLTGETTVITSPYVTLMQPRFNAGALGPIGPNQGVGFWMDDFWNLSIAATMLLNPKWTAIQDFYVQNILARLMGTSGWPQGLPDIYSTVVSDSSGTIFANWAAAWNASAPLLTPPIIPPAVPPALTTSGKPPQTDGNYYLSMRAALAGASQSMPITSSMYSQVQAALSYFEPFLAAWGAMGQPPFGSKWAVRHAPAFQTTITGATITHGGTTTPQSPSSLTTLVGLLASGDTLTLPAGIFSGSGMQANIHVPCTIVGAGMGKTIFDLNGVSMTNLEAFLSPFVTGVTVTDMTIKNVSVPDANGAALRDQGDNQGYTLTRVEVIGCQMGLMGNMSPITLNNCNLRANGDQFASGTASHDIYVGNDNTSPGASTGVLTINNTTVTSNNQATHCVKSRMVQTVISGGTFYQNPDSSGSSVGGSVIDIPAGGFASITGARLVLREAGSTSVANNLFVGFAMENANNSSTGMTLTLNTVRLSGGMGQSPAGGVIQAGQTGCSLVIQSGCVYDGATPPTLTGWASITGSFSPSGF